MKIICPLRDNENFTNIRTRCLADGMAAAGHDILYTRRNDPIPPVVADLVIHTGFAGSPALMDTVDKGIPFIITEHPTWRGPDAHTREEYETTYISWSYNGLLGGGFHHPAPAEPRPHPMLQKPKSEGAVIIYAQKPNDHSLRDSDHVAWIKRQMILFPEAELRHHPIMLSPAAALRQEPIGDAIYRTLLAITYTSTVGGEALIAGCRSHPCHSGSSAFQVNDRKAWIHEQSWWNITMKEAADRRMARHILKGYDEARARAEVGLVERPRNRVDRNVTMQEYYKEFGNG